MFRLLYFFDFVFGGKTYGFFDFRSSSKVVQKNPNISNDFVFFLTQIKTSAVLGLQISGIKMFRVLRKAGKKNHRGIGSKRRETQ
jgi:hypothetical protein